MATASEATWPAEFSDFKRFDAVLKCGICYDYMTNCMITSCSHTYCSLCIRKFMQYKNQCPACFEETYEIHLRNNRPLDEVITIFVKMKDKLQRALRLATIPIPVKEPKSETQEYPDLTPKTPTNKKSFEPKTPSSIRGAKTPNSAKIANQVSSPQSSKDKSSKGPGGSQSGEDVVFNGVKIPGIFNAPIAFPKARKPEELAACPVCHVEVPARNINIHLDCCLAAESDVCQNKAKGPPKRDPLPKRLYNLMPDKALKKVLKDYGLSTQGDRSTLIGRIKRYTVIYNSENDSSNPRPVPELIAQLEREEREEKRPNNTLLKSFTRLNQQQRTTIDRKADPEVIEQANKTYREENKEMFKRLIEQMRAREGKNIKPLKPPARVYSDDEDDPNQSAVFDPAVPSTSREAPSDIYSLSTQPNCDSDDDIFQDSDEKESSRGQIDWNKTRISEKETLVISSEDEGGAAESAVTVGSCDETRDKLRDRSTADEPADDETSEDDLISGNPLDVSRSELRPSTDLRSAEDQDQAPVNEVLPNPDNLHILISPSETCDEDSCPDRGVTDKRQSFNDSSEKENNENPPTIVEHRKLKKLPDPPAVPIDSEGSNDSDLVLERQKKASPKSTPRSTRSSRRSVAKSRSSTPSSSSSRGTKRKSEGSPGTKMVDTFDYLFERYNGERVDADVESDDNSDSNSLTAERLPDVESRAVRRSMRNRKAISEEPNESNAKSASNKRAKKDLSPAF